MRPFLYSVFLATFLCLFAYAFLGIYYEEYESAFEAMFNGSFTEGIPWDNFFYMAYLGVGELFALLTTKLPRVMWHDWLLAFSLWLSVVVIFTSIWVRFQGQLKTWQIALFNIALFAIFILDNGLNFNLTRVSFLVCGAAFIWFALIALEKPFNRSQLPAYVLCSLLFILGFLIRIETGILLFGFMLSYVYARKGIGKDLLLKTLPFAIPTVLITGGVVYDIATTSQHYKLVETGAEYQMSLGNVVPLETMKTPEDSMRYMGLMGGIVNDPAYVSYSFIKSILAPKSPWEIDVRLLTRAVQLLAERLSRYYCILTIYGLLLICAFRLLWADKKALFRYLVYTACFWGLLFLITYKLKMEHRVLSPFLFFFVSGNFCLLLPHGFMQLVKSKVIRVALAVVGIYAVAAATGQAYALTIDYKSNIKFNRERYAAFESAAKGKIVVPDFHVYKVMYFDNALPFKKREAGPFKKVFQMDMSAYSLIQPYRAYLDSNCKCNSADLGEFFDYLQANKQDFVFAGVPQRINLFQSYLNIVHHKAYIFERQMDFYIPSRADVRDAEDTLSLFTLK